MASLVFSIFMFGIQCIVLVISAFLLFGMIVSALFGGSR